MCRITLHQIILNARNLPHRLLCRALSFEHMQDYDRSDSQNIENYFNKSWINDDMFFYYFFLNEIFLHLLIYMDLIGGGGGGE